MELRDKLVALLADLPNYFGDHWQATEAADAILAIPEIRDALEVAGNLRANQERQRRMFDPSGGRALG